MTLTGQLSISASSNTSLVVKKDFVAKDKQRAAQILINVLLPSAFARATGCLTSGKDYLC